MANDDQHHANVAASIEARAHELYLDAGSLEMQQSINQWTDRIRGAVTEARMYARTGQVGLEERSWIELGAIAARRIAVLRTLAEDPEHVPAQELNPNV